MSQTVSHLRRRLILAGIASLLPLPTSAESRLTPSGPSGPFYPDLPLLDYDNDLTQNGNRHEIARGTICELTGKVLDINGAPLSGVRVEIWQCDHNGRYRHSKDDHTQPMDENFQGFGKTITDNQGRYRFRTIRPVAYPGRTPHIHAAVFREGMRPFVTQIYIADEPQNSDDFLFRRIPAILRPMVVAEFKPTGDRIVELTAIFDFILMEGVS
jgi:protocatechuate 3,4-dioxygenase beta subunit